MTFLYLFSKDFYIYDIIKLLYVKIIKHLKNKRQIYPTQSIKKNNRLKKKENIRIPCNYCKRNLLDVIIIYIFS